MKNTGRQGYQYCFCSEKPTSDCLAQHLREHYRHVEIKPDFTDLQSPQKKADQLQLFLYIYYILLLTAINTLFFCYSSRPRDSVKILSSSFSGYIPSLSLVIFSRCLAARVPYVFEGGGGSFVQRIVGLRDEKDVVTFSSILYSNPL